MKNRLRGKLFGIQARGSGSDHLGMVAERERDDKGRQLYFTRYGGSAHAEPRFNVSTAGHSRAIFHLSVVLHPGPRRILVRMRLGPTCLVTFQARGSSFVEGVVNLECAVSQRFLAVSVVAIHSRTPSILSERFDGRQRCRPVPPPDGP